MRTDSEIFIINPYIAGSPVKNLAMFFGRDDVYAWLRQHLRGRFQDNVIVLYGERRSGKTSVLYQMAAKLGDDTYIPVLIDLQGMALEGIDGFLWELARKIVISLRGVEGIPLLDRPSRQDFEENPRHEFEEVFLLPILAALGERRLLLMFDETDRLQEKIESGSLSPAALDYLRSLIQHSNRLNFIFSIGNRIQEDRHNFSNLFSLAVYRKISFIDQDFAEDLIIKPVTNHYTYTRPAIERILRLTSGQPYYTQLLCHNLFARWSDHKPPQLDITDVEAVLPDVIEQATPNLQFTWDDSTMVEKVVLATLAAKIPEYRAGVLRRTLDKTLRRAQLFPSRRDVNSALKRLFERDIINSQEPYEFRVELFQRWLTEYKQLDWVREELADTINEWEAKEQKRLAEAPTPMEQAQRWAVPVLAGVMIGALLALVAVWQSLIPTPIEASEAISTQVKLATEKAIAETRAAVAETRGDTQGLQAAQSTSASANASLGTVQAQLNEVIKQNEETLSAAQVQANVQATIAAEAREVAAQVQETATAQIELVVLANSTPTPTATATPTPTSLPTDTPTATPTTTPRPTATPTPKPQGRIAIPVDNRVGRYNVHIYNVADGTLIKQILNASQPSFNKNDGRLAVRAQRGDNETVWVYEADLVDSRMVNSSTLANSRPAWGPTGLVYENQASIKNGRFVWRIVVQESLSSALSTRASMLAGDIFDADRPLFPLWAANNDIIFSACNYWLSGGQCGIWRTPSTATVDNRGFSLPKNITSQGEIPTDVNRDRLLLMGREGSNWEVYLTSTEGGPLVNVSNHSANDGLATFSPDGRWIAFISDRGDGWGVWLVPADGGEATRLPIDGLRFATGDRNWTTERISWGP